MRIAIDARMIGYAGIGRYIQNLILSLSRLGKASHIYARFMFDVVVKRARRIITVSEFLKKGFARAGQFTWEAAARKTLKVYEEVLNA